MKNLATILIVAVIVFAVYYFFGNKIKDMLGFSSVDAIKVQSGDGMNVEMPLPSITYKGKEYKLDHTEGTFNVDGKDLPLWIVYGNSVGESANVAIGIPKFQQRPSCTNEEISLSDGTYKFYSEDEKWCLYLKI